MKKTNKIKLPFAGRLEAGKLLGQALQSYAGRTDVIILALPRGGVPIGYEVAQAIQAPLDLMLVRKLGVPGHKELALGAIATGGARVLNEGVIASYNISEDTINKVAAEEDIELQRRYRVYRKDKPPPELANRCVILVDDGIATGATMRAAIAALRQTGAAKVVVAVPVGAPETIALLHKEADEVICLAAPAMFFSLGQWYTDFTQVSDDQVCKLLESSSQDAVE